MKARDLFKRNLGLFYQVVQKKRKNNYKKLLMEINQEFRQNEINKLNEK